MSELSVEHRGHKITYNENSDEWSCWDFYGYSSVKLSNVRAYIDKQYLNIRKKNAVECFEFTHGSNKLLPTKVTEFVKHKVERPWTGNKAPVHTYTVASICVREGSSKASRRDVSIVSLVPDTPAAHEAYQKFMRLEAAAKLAKERANKAREEIPRISLADIDGLMTLDIKKEIVENQ